MAKRIVFTALLICTLGMVLMGCSRANDRRWVSDRRFLQVWDLYQETGDRDATVAVVQAQEWRPGEINECIYRLDQLIQAEAIHGEIDVPALGPPLIQDPGSEFLLN